LRAPAGAPGSETAEPWGLSSNDASDGEQDSGQLSREPGATLLPAAVLSLLKVCSVPLLLLALPGAVM
jgi:hypothetical protein